MFGALEAARDAEAPEALKNVYTGFSLRFQTFYGIPFTEPKIARASTALTYEGRLANELFGDYYLKLAKIRLWT